MSFRYLLFNKPFQVLSQFGLPKTTTAAAVPPKTLSNFIRVPNVYPAGRLDFDSEGLLLLTDDGRLQHLISDPKFAHPRTYCVQVENLIDEAALERLRQGVTIQGTQTLPCQARSIEPPQLWPRDPPVRYRQNIPTSWLELTLTEGRNRQVRRMTAAVGFPTLRLIRTAIGSLRLQELEPGAWRDLTSKEVEDLRNRRAIHKGTTL